MINNGHNKNNGKWNGWLLYKIDSILNGQCAYEYRKNFGKELANETDIDADLIVPVPDSGNKDTNSSKDILERSHPRNSFVTLQIHLVKPFT